jgi:hypothetical protein
MDDDENESSRRTSATAATEAGSASTSRCMINFKIIHKIFSLLLKQLNEKHALEEIK